MSKQREPLAVGAWNQGPCTEGGSQMVRERSHTHSMRRDLQREQKPEIARVKAIEPWKSVTAGGKTIPALPQDLDWDRAMYSHTEVKSPNIVIKHITLLFNYESSSETTRLWKSSLIPHLLHMKTNKQTKKPKIPNSLLALGKLVILRIL